MRVGERKAARAVHSKPFGNPICPQETGLEVTAKNVLKITNIRFVWSFYII